MNAEKGVLEKRVLYRAREFGHAIPRIIWDANTGEGIGICTRCGDGVLVYAGPDGPSINGTAYESACPGNTCDHGWRVLRGADGGTTLRCLHCGATRTEN